MLKREVKCSIPYLVEQWNQLTWAQQGEWEAWADAHKVAQGFTPAHDYTGLKWFIMCARTLYWRGLPFTLEPPFRELGNQVVGRFLRFNYCAEGGGDLVQYFVMLAVPEDHSVQLELSVGRSRYVAPVGMGGQRVVKRLHTFLSLPFWFGWPVEGSLQGVGVEYYRAYKEMVSPGVTNCWGLLVDPLTGLWGPYIDMVVCECFTYQ
jgi:hypothetical protein